WLIRLSRNVADLAHPVPIGVGDAGLASTALAESEETLAAPAQLRTGAAIALGHRRIELRRHIAVERGELPAGADHLLAARAALAAAEARTAAGRAGSLRLGGSRSRHRPGRGLRRRRLRPDGGLRRNRRRGGPGILIAPG